MPMAPVDIIHGNCSDKYYKSQKVIYFRSSTSKGLHYLHHHTRLTVRDKLTTVADMTGWWPLKGNGLKTCFDSLTMTTFHFTLDLFKKILLSNYISTSISYVSHVYSVGRECQVRHVNKNRATKTKNWAWTKYINMLQSI